MKWFRRDDNAAIVLCFDPLSEASIQEFEDAIIEVGKYFRFVKLSDLVTKLIDREPVRNLAVVALTHARKATFFHAVPYLLNRKVAFTLFLLPECIGTNRLPKNEEQAVRDSSGRLDIERLNPLGYFATWKEIMNVPPSVREFGLSTDQDVSIGNYHSFINDLRFVRQQTGEQVNLLASRDSLDGSKLRGEGILGVLTSEGGAVRSDTDPYHIPRWLLKKKG